LDRINFEVLETAVFIKLQYFWSSGNSTWTLFFLDRAWHSARVLIFLTRLLSHAFHDSTRAAFVPSGDGQDGRKGQAKGVLNGGLKSTGEERNRNNKQIFSCTAYMGGSGY